LETEKIREVIKEVEVTVEKNVLEYYIAEMLPVKALEEIMIKNELILPE